MPTFEEFLTKAMMEGQTVRLVPVPAREGGVEFYAHVQDHDSDTVDYVVSGDEITRLDRGAGG